MHRLGRQGENKQGNQTKKKGGQLKMYHRPKLYKTYKTYRKEIRYKHSSPRAKQIADRSDTICTIHAREN